ncbi:hypothetical protein PMAYCL1PPCAC_25044 [Pristionchus mayeri]|uniref:MATH domain-containing protein n=1 Tax=Pristionchus mayeri TaxID=1317129 RepID=A0AAN5D3A7_9BILA|nr:hypothetical protein PMAYCL1PPCAC_25044 [Pristionchus mayeri]
MRLRLALFVFIGRWKFVTDRKTIPRISHLTMIRASHSESCVVNYRIKLISWTSGEIYSLEKAGERFDSNAFGWGYDHFIKVEDLANAIHSGDFVKDDTVKMEVEFTVLPSQ